MLKIAIDRGGTFTDVYAEYKGKVIVKKLLSEDPANYDDSSREGIRRVLEDITGKPVPKESIKTDKIQWIRMGTTVATNALLERKGERTALLITKGFKDLLEVPKVVHRWGVPDEIRGLDRFIPHDLQDDLTERNAADDGEESQHQDEVGRPERR